MARKINAEALREIRQLVGYSQHDLAARTGLDQSYICRLEAGKHDGSPKVLRKLADGLGVSLGSITIPLPGSEPEPTVAA